MTKSQQSKTAKAPSSRVKLPLRQVSSRKKRAGAAGTDTSKPRKSKSEIGKMAARDTKRQMVFDLLQRPEGSTLAALCEATGWQQHSVRGFLAGQVKKTGLKLTSEKKDGVRRYHVSK